jgi:integrase/recombinase XerD
LNVGTRYNYLVTFKKWVEFCRERGFEPTSFDLVMVKQFLSQYKPTSRQGYAFRLRKIFEFNGEAAQFKVKTADNDLPEVLSEHEVNSIVRVTESLKWRTIFRVTYDGALRKHEVCGLKIKHVRIDKFGAEIYVPSTKSQSLWLRLIDSVPLLQQWLEVHPDRENREAWVFPGRDQNEQLSETAFYFALKRAAVKAHVKKRVFPHVLRHSRLAWLKKYGVKIEISDSIICKMYGRWSSKNAHRMLDRYGRIEPAEGNEIILRAAGKLSKDKQVKESLVQPQKCPRCKTENDALAKFCKTCGMVLNLKDAQEIMDRQNFMKEMDKIFKRDPEKEEKFLKLLSSL